MAEIVRAGILSVDEGQTEAAHALGMTQRPDHAADRAAAGDAGDHPADRQRVHQHAEDHRRWRSAVQYTELLRVGADDRTRELRDHADAVRGRALVPGPDQRLQRRPVLPRAPLRPRLAARAAADAAAAAPASLRRDRGAADDAPMVHAEGVHKSFGSSRCSRASTSRSQPGEVLLPDRPVRLGQVDVPALHQPPGEDQRRPAVRRRRAGRLPPGGRQALRAAASRRSPRSAREIGMVFQRFNLFPHMTALENVIEAPIRVKGETQGRRRRERGRALLDRVGLADKADAYPAPALRRPAAARRHRPRAGDGAEADALRRADLARSTPSSSARCSTSCATSPRTA